MLLTLEASCTGEVQTWSLWTWQDMTKESGCINNFNYNFNCKTESRNKWGGIDWDLRKRASHTLWVKRIDHIRKSLWLIFSEIPWSRGDCKTMEMYGEMSCGYLSLTKGFPGQESHGCFGYSDRHATLWLVWIASRILRTEKHRNLGAGVRDMSSCCTCVNIQEHCNIQLKSKPCKQATEFEWVACMDKQNRCSVKTYLKKKNLQGEKCIWLDTE